MTCSSSSRFCIHKVLIGVRKDTISLDIEDEQGNQQVFYFDPEGRLRGAYLNGRLFRRGMDNRIVEKWTRAENGRRFHQHRQLSETESQQLIRLVHDIILRVRQSVRHEDAHIQIQCLKVPQFPSYSISQFPSYSISQFPDSPISQPSHFASAPHQQTIHALDLLLRWDFEALKADGKRFSSIYHSVSILPPDQYMAVVVQATQGCHWNRCAFCNLYRHRPFRIRSPLEFRRHIQTVKDYLGTALLQRKSVFLGDANALVTPQPKLRRLLQILHEELPLRCEWRDQHPSHQFRISHSARRRLAPEPPHPELVEGTAEGGATTSDDFANSFSLNGVYSFLDVFSTRKGVDEFAELSAWHIKRVYIGLETGDDALLKFLNKPGSAQDAVRMVEKLKAAGINVGVIVMVGVGGDKFAESHIHGTIEVLNAMRLGRGDFIYFSEFVEYQELEYASRARREGIRPLSAEEMQAQQHEIRRSLRFSDQNNRPKIAVYDLREFIY